ncbi:MAG: bifunctional diguanylate cyclase/phosphodiesterase [Eubacterium sp.]|nr:bifunctional diguanylate cyclase/phosphodiesterase [Eubacterium sp.]
MQSFIRKKFGLLHVDSDEKRLIDRSNAKKMIFVCAFIVGICAFLFVNIYMEETKIAENIRNGEVPGVAADIGAEPNGEVGSNGESLPEGISSDAVAGAGEPDEGKPSLDTYVDDPMAYTVDPSMGSGSFLGLVTLCLGINNYASSDFIIMFTSAVAAFNVIMLLYGLIYTLRKSTSSILGTASAALFSAFYVGLGVAVYSMNGGSNLMVFLLFNAVIPAIITINPFLEGGIYILGCVGFCTASVYYSSMNTAMVVNVVIFFLLTMFLCIAQYTDKVGAVRNELLVGRLSTHDELTGMRNRRALKLDNDRFLGKNIFLVMMDLDDFKYFNDSFGHEFGDEVLRRFSRILLSHFGQDDVYRYGGDEFMIVVLGDDEEKFVKKLEACREEVKAMTIGEHTDLYLTSSCGYVKGPVVNWESIRVMSSIADQKLYEAKRLGKDRVVRDDYVPSPDDAERFKDWDRTYKSNDLDVLTNLPNKLHFFNRASKIISRSDSGELAVVYINIENFHLYNLEYGFDEGDKVLRDLADEIRKTFEGSLCSHFEGDRFVVLTQRENIVDRIKEVHKFGHSEERGVRLEVKAGIALLGDDTDIAVVCDKAMVACDSIKNKYDSDYRFYDKSLEKKRHEQQYFWDNLDKAIAEEQLVVYYQPIVRTMTGEMCEVEALVRWNDEEMGIIPPNTFISILEDSHLIHKVDIYVIERVCRDLASMRERGMECVPFSINLSRLDFWLCDILEIIEGLVQKYDIPRELLHFEITESALTERPVELHSQLQRLQNCGYQVWMDDFGSGYSSLNTLKDYNFDVMKVDMAFLADFGINKRSRKMIEIIIDMAKDMDVCSLVEGVETREQYDFLRGIGCEKVQGYYFAKPMVFEELIAKMGGTLKIENMELREYYDTIGRLSLSGKSFDLVGDTGREESRQLPVAVAELENNRIKLLAANPAFFKRLAQLKLMGEERIVEYINNPENDIYHSMRDAIEEAVNQNEITHRGMSMGHAYEVKVKYVISKNGKICVYGSASFDLLER